LVDVENHRERLIQGASRAKKRQKIIPEGVFSYEKNVTIFGLP
jgi:hypothetical protein